MSMTPEQQLDCFGVENIQHYKRNMEQSLTYETSGRGMVLMSLLSDVQEDIATGEPIALERSRKALNRVKYLIAEWISKPDRAGTCHKCGGLTAHWEPCAPGPRVGG
jgi:hypothetical protein